MNLNLSQKEQMKAQVTKTYTCPVNADIVSNSAGRNLNLSLKEKMKMEVVKLSNNTAHAMCQIIIRKNALNVEWKWFNRNQKRKMDKKNGHPLLTDRAMGGYHSYSALV